MFDAEFELEAELEDLMAALSRSNPSAKAEYETPQVRTIRDQSVITGQIARGTFDENRLTDAVFYDRHPEWKGKSLRYARPSLRQEWMQIRNAIVRPVLQRPRAIPQPVPAPLPKPAAPPVPAGSKDQFGFSNFDNIRYYRPNQYAAALTAQNAYQKVSSFLPLYQKISNATPRVSISLSDRGLGNLVFSMDRQTFAELVDDTALRDKAFEIMAAGVTSELVFTEDVIGILGLGLTLFDIARGLENERRLGSFGPDHDTWVKKQQFQFVVALVAEDLSKRNWGGGYFISRNTRDLAVELATRYAQFRDIYYEYTRYFWLDGDLGRFQGNIPDRIPPTMGPAR